MNDTTNTSRAWGWLVVLGAMTAAAVLMITVARQGGVTLLFQGEGAFGPVRVVERPDGLRELYMGLGRARQTAAYPDRPRHLELAYTRAMMATLDLVPDSGRVAFVGLGGGAMPAFARSVRPDLEIEAVEIDPVIVRVAAEHFGVVSDARMRIVTGDGRAFLEEAESERFDLVILDAFSDSEIPLELATREFLETVRHTLTGTGFAVTNLLTTNSLHPSMVATYLAVFPDVATVTIPGRQQEVLVAGFGQPELTETLLLTSAREISASGSLEQDLSLSIQGQFRRPSRAGGSVLEDATAGR